MPVKQSVRITLRSQQEEQIIVQQVQGDLYHKGASFYLRYPEMDEAMGRTTTMVKVETEAQVIKVIRQGDITSEQQFSLGQRHISFYRTPYSTMELTTHTTKLDIVTHNNNAGTLSWTYDLYVDGEFTATSTLTLNYMEV